MLLGGPGAWLGKTPLSEGEKEYIYYAMAENGPGPSPSVVAPYRNSRS